MIEPTAEQLRQIEGSDNRSETGFRAPSEINENEDYDNDYDELEVSTEASHTSRDRKGLDNFVFSQDFLPVRYDRHSQSDMPLKLICFIQLGIDVAMLLIFIMQGVNGFESNKTWFHFVQYTITAACFVLLMFWLNYKLHVVLCALYRLVIDLDFTKRNNKYYSGLEIPDFYVQSKEYPPITIQIPVYKESLQNTLKPTILNCCREADRYMDETGALCNIIICDDGYNLIPEADRFERIEFYKEMGLGFTARPHPSKYPRKGRFKKAGNLNFSMNYGGCFYNSEGSPDEVKEQVEKLIEIGAAFGGDTRYGDYILLIDSDTRLPIIPMQENGCLKRLAKEMLFDGQEVSFIQCYTAPYMSLKSTAEKCVYHHTCNIYNSIMLATAFNSMAPLVGHNAFLNMKAITEVAHVDESIGYYYFWAEDRISEDFDLMMRSCEKGYIGRYAAHSGVFLEGVSFSYMTEYFKVSKFACGAAELIYNPMSDWCRDGVVSSDLIGFIKSEQVEWYNKMAICAYIINFIALASAHLGLIFNVFLCEWLADILPFVLLPVNLMWEAIFLWTVLGGVVNYLFGLRLGFDKWLLAKQSVRESLFLTCLYGSCSVRFCIMSLTHLFKWNLSFGATAKDDEKITLLDWIRSTPMETAVYTVYIFLMFVRVYFLTPPDKMAYVLYFGCTPLIWSIILFWAGPIFFDILPSKKDKTTQQSYNEEEKMFSDKYFTQVPQSKKVTSIKVGSSIKLAPNGSSRGGGSVYSSRHSVRDYASEMGSEIA